MRYRSRGPTIRGDHRQRSPYDITSTLLAICIVTFATNDQVTISRSTAVLTDYHYYLLLRETVFRFHFYRRHKVWICTVLSLTRAEIRADADAEHEGGREEGGRGGEEGEGEGARVYCRAASGGRVSWHWDASRVHRRAASTRARIRARHDWLYKIIDINLQLHIDIKKYTQSYIRLIRATGSHGVRLEWHTTRSRSRQSGTLPDNGNRYVRQNSTSALFYPQNKKEVKKS